MPKFSSKIFFWLTLLAGIWILYPSLDYQPILAQGDHGRDLYAASVAFEGRIPYRDYWWVYGPLMPYYYAFFFKYLGVHVPAVLTGKALLSLAGALFIYGILTALSVRGALAFIGALWFLAFPPEFFITYNHAGGTTLLLALTFFIVQYLARARVVFLYGSLGAIFLLSLVKINFGAAALAGLLAAVFSIDRICKNPVARGGKIFYWAAFVLPAVVLLIYGILLRGLPLYAIRQCLPYFGGDQPYHVSLTAGVGMLLRSIYDNVKSSGQNFFFALIVVGTALRTAARLASNQIPAEEKTRLLTAIGFLAFFYFLTVHEFLLSGVFYRSLWAKPFAYLLMFVFLDAGTRDLRRGVRVLLCGALLTIAGLNVLNTHSAVKTAKTLFQYLGVPRGKVFLGNPYPWLATVTQTVSFLETNLRKDELFFALPYDPLYYFLTGRPAPTRQLIFFDHIKIPPQQEKEILAELENNKVNWIVLTSRRKAAEYGLGTLGETYCPLIEEYIEENFTTAAQFGDWTNEPGWAWNHGVKILKRR